MSAPTIVDSILPDALQPTVRVEALDHFFGEGDSRNQVLFDNQIEIGTGQLVIMTGPSGAGKTTLLTLVGALRSVQHGRIEVLGQSLSELGRRELVEMRRNVGFIFQMHNLFVVGLRKRQDGDAARRLPRGRDAPARQRDPRSPWARKPG
jgi:putative ABC transport system ATP-binding protein